MHTKKISFSFDLAREIPIFSEIPDAQLEVLLKGARVIRHQYGDLLFKEGMGADYFGYVMSGAYKLSLCD